MVEETKEIEEFVEFVMHWEEVKVGKGAGVNKTSDDGLLEVYKYGMVEEAKEDGCGEVGVGWEDDK